MSALATRAISGAMATKKALSLAKISRQHREKRDYRLVAKLAFLLQESNSKNFAFFEGGWHQNKNLVVNSLSVFNQKEMIPSLTTSTTLLDRNAQYAVVRSRRPT